MRRLLIIALLLGCSALAHATACPSGYATWNPLYILAQGSTTTNQTNFPMPFKGNAALSSTNSLNSGLDVVFCTGSNSGNLLPYELVTGTYNSSTGAGLWWFQAPTVSYNTIETIYVGVGKSSANDSNAAGVWQNVTGSLNALQVHHFGTSSTLTLTDSTGNCTATNHGATATAGPSGLGQGAAAFVHSSSQYIDTGCVSNVTSSLVSMLAWVNPTSGFEICQRVFSNLVSPTYAGYELFLGGSCAANGSVEIQTGTGGSLNSLYSTAAISAGSWSSIAATQNGSGNTNMKVYFNGANKSGTGAGTYAIGTSTNNMAIGAVVAISGYSFNGSIAEAEIYQGFLPADFILDWHNATNSPSTFYAFGPLTVTTTTLPNTTTAANVSDTLAASGGVPSYTWSINGGGSLGSISGCGGLSLSSGGVITGTPTTAGVCSFTALVTDSVSNTATQALSLNIYTAPTVTFVQEKYSANYFGTPVPLAFTSNVTAPNILVIVGSGSSANTITGITESGTASVSTWTSCGTLTFGSCLYATVNSTGSFTASVATSNGSANYDISGFEISGANTPDLHVSATGTGTTLSVSPGALASAAEGIIAFGGSNGAGGTFSAGTIGGATPTGYMTGSPISYAFSEYLASNSFSGTQTATIAVTPSETWKISEVSFYDVPTVQQAAAPTFSPVAGTYFATTSVAITSGTSGATIVYTTDGTTPGTGSGNCTPTGTGVAISNGASVSVASSETLNAIACESAYTNSAVATAAYTIFIFPSDVAVVTDTFLNYPSFTSGIPNAPLQQPDTYLGTQIAPVTGLTSATTGGSWSVGSGMLLTNDSGNGSGANLGPYAPSLFLVASRNDISFPPNQSASVITHVGSSGPDAGACVRAGNYCFYYVSNSSCELSAGPAQTSLEQGACSPTDGGTIELQVYGQSPNIYLRPLVNGSVPSAIPVYIDSVNAYNSGTPGFAVYGGSSSNPPLYSWTGNILSGEVTAPSPTEQSLQGVVYTDSLGSTYGSGATVNWPWVRTITQSPANPQWSAISTNCSNTLGPQQEMRVPVANDAFAQATLTSAGGDGNLHVFGLGLHHHPQEQSGIPGQQYGGCASTPGCYDFMGDYWLPSVPTPAIGCAANTKNELCLIYYLVNGSVTSGTFNAATDTITQTSTGASAFLNAPVNSTNGFQLLQITGTADGTHTWVGSPSGAVFTPTVASISSCSESGTTVTCLSALAPPNGASVVISGTSVSGYNSTFTVLSNPLPSSTQFSFTATSGLGSATGGSVNMLPALLSPSDIAVVNPGSAVNNAGEAYNRVTYIYNTYGGPHGYSFQAGDVARFETHGPRLYGLVQMGGTGQWHALTEFYDFGNYNTGGYPFLVCDIATGKSQGSYMSTFSTGSLTDFVDIPESCLVTNSCGTGVQGGVIY